MLEVPAIDIQRSDSVGIVLSNPITPAVWQASIAPILADTDHCNQILSRALCQTRLSAAEMYNGQGDLATIIGKSSLEAFPLAPPMELSHADIVMTVKQEEDDDTDAVQLVQTSDMYRTDPRYLMLKNECAARADTLSRDLPLPKALRVVLYHPSVVLSLTFAEHEAPCLVSGAPTKDRLEIYFPHKGTYSVPMEAKHGRVYCLVWHLRCHEVSIRRDGGTSLTAALNYAKI